MCICVFLSVYTCTTCVQEFVGVTRVLGSPGTWITLETAMWVLGNEPGSFARAARALNC